ncbi:MAG: phosphotransacetylase family protein [Deltaproteobacteria bacterium]|nr:phosphotransacetylase family protein [Deltaproteobacteria bacterium]
MPVVFIGSTGDRAGHSLLTWALARRLMERGLSIGLLKPFGTHPTHQDGLWTDRDAVLFKDVLGLKEPLNRICPYLISEESWKQKPNEAIIDEIKLLCRELAAGKDVLLLMGSRQIYFDDASLPIPDLALIEELQAEFLLLHRYRQASKSIYAVLSVVSLLKERFKGVLINRIPPPKWPDVESRLIPSLTQMGIPVVALIEEDPILSCRTLGEIKEILGGKLLCGEAWVDRLADGMTVGSGDLTGDFLIFKRVYNKVVLLAPAAPDGESEEAGGPRTVAGIILTGGRIPPPQVLKTAQDADLPLILVQEDTFVALENLERSRAALTPKDENRVRRVTHLLDREGSLDRLLGDLDLGC